MTFPRSSTTEDSAPEDEQHPVAERPWALIAYICALALVYGFEVFSFNLTLDEELFGNGVLDASSWLSEGRWTMAALAFVVPSVIVPVVSTGIGVGLSGLGLWLIGRRFLGLSPWMTAAGAALALSIPTLAFTFSFATFAYGIGVANVLLFAFAAGLDSPSWLRRVLGILAAAAAIAVYDPFLIAVAALGLGFVIKRGTLRSIGLAALGLAGAFAVSRVVGSVAVAVSGVPVSAHVSAQIDIPGFLSNPVDRLSSAVAQVWDVANLSTELFGLRSPWLAIALTVLAAPALVGLARRSGTAGTRAVRWVAFALLMALPIAAEAVSHEAVRLRAMIYLPMVILILFWTAARGSALFSAGYRRVVLRVAASLVVLAIVGNAAVSNRLFASAATSYELDQKLAYAISYERDKVAKNNTATLPLVVSGSHQWPSTETLTRRETLGVSFFARDSVASVRIVSFLTTQGIRVRTATEDETRAAQEFLAEMPPYPQDGWVAYHDGILLVQFTKPD